MTAKRLLLALFAFALMIPLSGCGCRRDCNRQTYSPPPGPCCDKGAVPPPYLPTP